MKRFISAGFGLCLCILSSNVLAGGVLAPPSVKKSSKGGGSAVFLQTVYRLKVLGDVDVALKQGRSGRGIHYRMDPAFQSLVQVRVDPQLHQMVITSRGGVHRPHVDVFLTYPLRSLCAENGALVHGQVRTNHLHVRTDDANVNLSGRVSIDQIWQQSSGRVRISWVDSHALLVWQFGAGRVLLSGKVKDLYARVFGRALLDAQYLRARSVWIDSRDRGHVLVTPVRSIEAFASGHSQVFYMKEPRRLLDFASFYGNVLQLDWRN